LVDAPEKLTVYAGHGQLHAVAKLLRRVLAPPDRTDYARRVDIMLLAEIAWPAGKDPLAFVCGPTWFVDAAANREGHSP
jgi:hypothetical protein